MCLSLTIKCLIVIYFKFRRGIKKPNKHLHNDNVLYYHQMVFCFIFVQISTFKRFDNKQTLRLLTTMIHKQNFFNEQRPTVEGKTKPKHWHSQILINPNRKTTSSPNLNSFRIESNLISSVHTFSKNIYIEI